MCCKQCQYIFNIKSSPKKRRGIIKRTVSNWNEELSIGDIVKIVRGSGPYYLLSNGEKHYLSINGIVRIEDIEDNGFWAVHHKLKQNRGSFFVYMGPKRCSPIVDHLVRQKHKVIKLDNFPVRA